jgi:hypothetical protein
MAMGQKKLDRSKVLSPLISNLFKKGLKLSKPRKNAVVVGELSCEVLLKPPNPLNDRAQSFAALAT